MEHMDGLSQSSYYQNLLSLLNLGIFSRLGACDPVDRVEAHDRMVELAALPVQDAFALSESEQQAYRELSDSLLSEHDKLLDGFRRDGQWPAIERLRDCFGLDRNEMLLLTAILAPQTDERFRKIYRLFQGRSEPAMGFLLRLIEPDGLLRYRNAELLGRNGTLISHALIEPVGAVSVPGPDTAYQPAPGLLEWLNSSRRMDIWYGRAKWSEKASRTPDDFPDFSGIRMAVEMAEVGKEPVPLVSFYGPDGERLLQAAETLSADMERPCLELDLRDLDPSEILRFVRFALRNCALDKGILALYGMDASIDSGNDFLFGLRELFAGWNVPVILLTKQELVFPPKEFAEDRLLLRVAIESLTGKQRFRVWKQRLENLPLDEGLDDESLRILAGQFTLNSAQIRSAVNAGLGLAVTEDRDLSIADLYEGARRSSMHHLSSLARKMQQRYDLKDLVLPEKQIGEIEKLIAMARNRSLVLEDWELGKKLVSGRGISALFTGVPGTGKTLSAQVIAGELGLDLYRVDLSTIISKYIGETEKNLEKIFTEAQNSNVILFFDEADSLFGRRSEVSDSHDRYANIEVSYLLQRIETYDGIVLMATNLGANLDEAFTRRIHFIIDFPFPDEATRLRLWELLLPEKIEKENDIDLPLMARAYKIAGGNIRNAVVWAVYDAARNKRPLCGADLHRGVEREYQKMGKVIPYSFS